MRFDKHGNKITSIHRTHQIYQDLVVSDLGFKFDGLPDNTVKIIRDMVNKDKIKRLDTLIITLNRILN